MNVEERKILVSIINQSAQICRVTNYTEWESLFGVHLCIFIATQYLTVRANRDNEIIVDVPHHCAADTLHRCFQCIPALCNNGLHVTTAYAKVSCELV